MIPARGRALVRRPLRIGLSALLLLVRSNSWAQSGAPSIVDACNSLNEALAAHDRSRFEQLLAADATFTLPVPTHGAEAIVRAWIPFLLPTGSTITLTVSQSGAAASGDLAYSAGSFAITGQSSGGPVLDATGEYVAVWKLIDGRWKLAYLAGGRTSAPSGPSSGLGGYRFGMTLDQVRQVQDCRPYTNVSQTGGLECGNYMFEGRKINISFLFNAGQLRRIQLWLYEGNSDDGAKEAIGGAIDFLRKTGGGVSIGAQPGVEVTAEGVMAVLKSGTGNITQFDLSTPAGSQPEVWFGRVARLQQNGYFVFLFVDPRQGR